MGLVETGQIDSDPAKNYPATSSEYWTNDLAL